MKYFLILEFFIACLILGLEYLHANNLVHLDIRPENLVLNENGYLNIVNFGSAKYLSSEKKGKNKAEKVEIGSNLCYLAPEILNGMPYSLSTDFYSIGVILHELIMMGRKPVAGNTLRTLKEKLMCSQPQIKPEELPKGYSQDIADFVNKLLTRKPVDRMGYLGIDEIKKHPWLNDIKWRDLYFKRLDSPLKIININDAYSNVLYSPEKMKTLKKNDINVNFDKKTKKIFNDFLYYDKISAMKMKNDINTLNPFFNPHTKSFAVLNRRNSTRSEILLFGKDLSQMLNKISTTDAPISTDSRTARSGSTKQMPFVNPNIINEFDDVRKIKKNVIPGTNIFCNNITIRQISIVGLYGEKKVDLEN